MPRKPAVIDTFEELLEGTRPQKVDPDFFQKLLNEYPQQAGTKLYVYRLAPKIDLTIIGLKDSNLQFLQAPYPADLRKWVMSQYGGGKFLFRFNDHNLPHAPIATTDIEIPVDEAEPILDVRTLVRGKPDGEQLILKWLNQGKIIKDEAGLLHPAPAGSPPQATAPGAAGDGTPASVIDLMNHTYKSMFDQAMKQNDPVAMARLMKELKGDGMDLPTMLALFQQLQPKENPMMAMFMNMMLEMQKQTAAINQMLMQRLLEKPEAGAAQSSVSQFKEMLEAMGEMRDMFPQAAGSRGGGGWVETLKAVAPALAPALAPLAMRLLSPGPEQPAATPQTAAPGTQPARGTAAGPQPVPDPVQQQMQQGNRQLGNLIERCLNMNLSGFDLHSTILVQFGEDAYTAIKAMGADQIKANLQQHAPEIWQRIAARGAAIDELLTEFLTAQDEEPEEDGEKK